MQDKKQVFISYSRKHDWLLADHFKNFIEALNYTVWLDDYDIDAGKPWRDAIDQAIRSARVLVVIVTDEALRSEYITFEWSFALGASVDVIPVVCREINSLHPRLAELQYVDYHDRHLVAFAEEQLRNRLRELIDEKSVQEPAPEFIENLSQAVDDEEADIQYRQQVAVILGHIKASQSIPKLIEATRDPSINVRIAAIQALSAFGPDGLIANALIDIIDDEVWEVRQEVFDALIVVGAPCANRLMNIINCIESTKYRDGKDVGAFRSCRGY